MKIASFFVILMLFFSCDNQDKDRPYKELKNDYTLVKTSSITLPLDSMQGFFTNSFSQLKLQDGTNLLSMLNRTNAAIYYYDIETGENVKKVQLEIGDGPNGIGNDLDLTVHADISKDSIFLINEWTSKMFLLNDKGKVLRTYKYVQSDVFNNRGPFYIPISNDNRPFVKDNKVYIHCDYSPDGYKDKGVMLILDLKKGEFSTEFTPSPLYLDYCWGTPFSLNVLSTYDSHKNRFVLSFGTDPNVYSWTNGELESKKPLQSMYFETKPYSEDVSDYMQQSSFSKRSEYSLLSPKFYKILHLKEQNIFLRETFLERDKDELVQGAMGLKKSFIIADENLERLGEFRVPDGKYLTSNFFVTDRGVYIADLEYYNNTEDSLKFDFYEPKVRIK